MTLDHFCTKLKALGLSHANMALAILWFFDEQQPDIAKSAGDLAKIIRESGLGASNTTLLGTAIKGTGRVNGSTSGFRLKTLARAEIRESLKSILGQARPAVDQDLGYLPRAVWFGTRGYIEKVCVQLNGCYQFEFWDAASVMVRRLVETLIIEAYEKLNRQAEIKDANGNYLMLRDLIGHATGSNPITLGREAKEALAKVKEIGDRAAHSRMYNATRADLAKVESGVRIVVDELINLAQLRRP